MKTFGRIGLVICATMYTLLFTLEEESAKMLFALIGGTALALLLVVSLFATFFGNER